MDGPGETHRRFSSERRAIPRTESDVVYRKCSCRDVQPCHSPWLQDMFYLFAIAEDGCKDARVLAERKGTGFAVRGHDQAETARLCVSPESCLGIHRVKTRTIGLKPDLQEVHLVSRRRICLAMGHAGPGRDELHVVAVDGSRRARSVFVGKCPIQDVREDLKVPMRVHWKPVPGRHSVLVDDAKDREPSVGRIVVLPE